MENSLLILNHELRECLIDGGLVFVILIEDKSGEIRVMMNEIPEREDYMMTRIVNSIFGCD